MSCEERTENIELAEGESITLTGDVEGDKVFFEYSKLPPITGDLPLRIAKQFGVRSIRVVSSLKKKHDVPAHEYHPFDSKI